MASHAQEPIPAFFSVFFLWFDPVVALWGIYMNLFTPAVTVDASVPGSMLAYSPILRVFTQQQAAFLMGSAWLEIVLQRYTRDVGVWKILQTSTLIVDSMMLYAIWDSLGVQGRRSLFSLRVEDWGAVGVLGSVAVIRLAFVAGIGFKKAEAAKKKP